jgi:hypothetical protein
VAVAGGEPACGEAGDRFLVRPRGGDVVSAPYFGQPGDPYDDPDPQVDTTLPALFADDPDAAATVADMLAVAEMVKFGFEPASDEAKGLHLLIGAVRRANAEATS